MAFIGIDLGTTFIKAAILDPETCQLRQIVRVSFPRKITAHDPLHCEFEPSAILNLVSELLSQLARCAFRYEGVLMCTQMSWLVLMGDDGQVRSNCVGWRDQRSLEPHPSGVGRYYDVMRRNITEQQRVDLGNEFAPGAPAAVLFWLAEQGRLDSGLIPVSLADFVLSTICDSEPGAEITNAMAYGLLNLKSLDWHEEVISGLGLDQLRWPPVRRCRDIVGYLKIGADTIP